MTSRIMLVDDEDRILDVLACMFKEIGWDVATASTPAEALRLVVELLDRETLDNIAKLLAVTGSEALACDRPRAEMG